MHNATLLEQSSSNIEDVRKDGVLGTSELMRFLDLAMSHFRGLYCNGKKVRTMRDITVPANICFLTIEDQVYRIGASRSVWFERRGSSYDENSIIIAEVIDENGKLRQLQLGRSTGRIVVTKSRLLGVNTAGTYYGGFAPYTGD